MGSSAYDRERHQVRWEHNHLLLGVRARIISPGINESEMLFCQPEFAICFSIGKGSGWYLWQPL